MDCNFSWAICHIPFGLFSMRYEDINLIKTISYSDLKCNSMIKYTVLTTFIYRRGHIHKSSPSVIAAACDNLQQNNRCHPLPSTQLGSYAQQHDEASK